GASRGIGRTIALALARAGAHVIALARTEGALTELDDEIRALGKGGATLVPLDIADFDGLDRLRAAIFEPREKLAIPLRPARLRPRHARGARAAPAARARAAEGIRPRRRDQLDRQLAPDPLARSAAAAVGCRARGVRDLRRRAQALPLLGPVRGVESRARGAG